MEGRGGGEAHARGLRQSGVRGRAACDLRRHEPGHRRGAEAALAEAPAAVARALCARAGVRSAFPCRAEPGKICDYDGTPDAGSFHKGLDESFGAISADGIILQLQVFPGYIGRKQSISSTKFKQPIITTHKYVAVYVIGQSPRVIAAASNEPHFSEIRM